MQIVPTNPNQVHNFPKLHKFTQQPTHLPKFVQQSTSFSQKQHIFTPFTIWVFTLDWVCGKMLQSIHKEQNCMAYLKNFSGQSLLKIEGGRIKECSSGMTKYIINGNRLTDFSGRTLCTFDGERIKDFSGRTLLTVSTDTVRNFSGQTIARFDTSSIKNFSGQTQYRLDGFLSRSEMMALIAIIYAI